MFSTLKTAPEPIGFWRRAGKFLILLSVLCPDDQNAMYVVFSVADGHFWAPRFVCTIIPKKRLTAAVAAFAVFPPLSPPFGIVLEILQQTGKHSAGGLEADDSQKNVSFHPDGRIFRPLQNKSTAPKRVFLVQFWTKKAPEALKIRGLSFK